MAGLLLALIDLPDIGWPLRRMAGSLERIAGIKPGEGAAEAPEDPPVSVPAESPAAGSDKSVVHITPREVRPRGVQPGLLRRAKGLEPCLSFFSAPC